MPKYVLNVYCRRNGVSCDSGHHTTKEFADDKSACDGMEKIVIKDLLPHYDQVLVTIMEEKRVVGEFQVNR